MIEKITVRGARQHNLKNIDVEIPRHTLTVITGLSGSGKSSLAFDTIYAEGQRRYVETLSAYARQFLDQMERPEVDSIDGLSPAISIEQRTTSRSPRSTVGTITEIYDYLRLLYSSIGAPHCPNCGKAIARQSTGQIVERILALDPEQRIMILAPIVRGRKGEFRKELEKLAREGFLRARIDGQLHSLDEPVKLDKRKNHTIEVVVDRLAVKPGIAKRLEGSLETAMKLARGIVLVAAVGGRNSFTHRRWPAWIAVLACRLWSRVHFPSTASTAPAPPATGWAASGTSIRPRSSWTGNRPLLEGGLGPGAGSGYMQRQIHRAAATFGIKLRTPFGDLPRKAQQSLLYGGSRGPSTGRRPRLRAGRSRFDGIIPILRDWYEESTSEAHRERYLDFMSPISCTACQGQRLRPESLAVKVNKLSISDFTALPISRAVQSLGAVRLSPRETQIAGRIVGEIAERLEFLQAVGLGYLSLDRPAGTLSGGEGQRIRLATQIGSRLRGVLYVLDEPSIGLHHRDNDRLLRTLERLRDLGNTVLVVEHDEETIRRADYVVDLGPGAGRQGGHLVACGSPANIAAHPDSLTGHYLGRAAEDSGAPPPLIKWQNAHCGGSAPAQT